MRGKKSPFCGKCGLIKTMPSGKYFDCRPCKTKLKKLTTKKYGELSTASRQKIVATSEKRAAKKREFVNKLKDKPCTDCGGKFHPCAMDFDHLGDKSFSISSAVNCRTIIAIMSEMEKCELVCANCHRVRTYNRRQEAKVTKIYTPHRFTSKGRLDSLSAKILISN